MKTTVGMASVGGLRWLALAFLVGTGAMADAAGPGLTGRVLGVDEDGKLLGTVPGATIELKGGGSTTSDGAGRYTIDVGPGSYPYKVTAAGYKDEDSGRGVQQQLSEGYAVFNFTLTKGKTDPESKPQAKPEAERGRLKGRVYEKTPKGDVGIGGAVIALRREGGRGITRVVARGADAKGQGAGQYEVGLEEGQWRASVTARGFAQFVDPKVIVVPAGGEATRDFLLQREEASTDQGILGTVRVGRGEGTPVPMSGVVLRILRLPGGEAAVKPGPPDGKGQFKHSLSVGVYRVIAEAKGYETASSRPTHVFKGRYSRVNLTLVRESRKPPGELGLDVLVLDAATRKPVRGAEVLMRQGDQPLSEAARGQTGGNGVVALGIPGDGAYSAMARAAGYPPGGIKFTVASGQPSKVEILLRGKASGEPAVTEQPPTTTPVPGRQVPVVPMAPVTPAQPMPPPDLGPGTLTVQVIERGGGPIAGAGVTVMRGKARVGGGATDRLGVWRIDLPPGSYAVKAAREGFGSGGTEVGMGTRDGTATIQLSRLRETAPPPPSDLTLAIQVVERGGKPISGAQVMVIGGKARSRSGQTDKGGWWRTQVGGGTTYQVKASRQGFSTGGAVVNVGTRDATQQITLVRQTQTEIQTPTLPGFQIPTKPPAKLPQTPTRKPPGSSQIAPQKITPMTITPIQPQTIKRLQTDDKKEDEKLK